MIKRISSQVANPNEDNYVVKSTKDFFTAHRTTLKVTSNFLNILLFVDIVERVTHSKLIPSITFSSHGALVFSGMLTCTILSAIAKNFEQSLAASDAKHKYSRVDAEL